MLLTPLLQATLDIAGEAPGRIPNAETSLGELINSLLTAIMAIAGLLILFYLVWGGIEWITSGGDKSKTESARNKITQAVIGIIILSSSVAIFYAVMQFLGVSDGLSAESTTGLGQNESSNLLREGQNFLNRIIGR